jgi:hypothetical protein
MLFDITSGIGLHASSIVFDISATSLSTSNASSTELVKLIFFDKTRGPMKHGHLSD